MAEYLSEHFTLEEMTYSDTAKAKGIKNIPTDVHKNTLKHTCQYLLEPLRTLLAGSFGTKVYVYINSGYRGADLNKAVGGVKTSQHCTGEAVDIRCYKVVGKVQTLIQPIEIYNLVKTYVKAGALSVDQCIYEVSGSSIWVHLSHSAWGKTKDRKQFLKYTNGTYTTDTL